MIAARRLPAPFVFGVVLVIILALIIYLGAWAVSADVGGQRTLAFGVPGTTPTLSGENVLTDSLADSTGKQSDASDSWWGNAFLSACPLH